MDWLASCYNAQLEPGARLNVAPEMWSSEMRPPYHPAVGDTFNVDFVNRARLAGKVIASQGVQIEVSFSNGVDHIIMRTPAATVRALPSVMRSIIPHEDWVVVQ